MAGKQFDEIFSSLFTFVAVRIHEKFQLSANQCGPQKRFLRNQNKQMNYALIINGLKNWLFYLEDSHFKKLSWCQVGESFEVIFLAPPSKKGMGPHLVEAWNFQVQLEMARSDESFFSAQSRKMMITLTWASSWNDGESWSKTASPRAVNIISASCAEKSSFSGNWFDILHTFS